MPFGAGTSDKGRQTVNAAPELLKADILAMVKRGARNKKKQPASDAQTTTVVVPSTVRDRMPTLQRSSSNVRGQQNGVTKTWTRTLVNIRAAEDHITQPLQSDQLRSAFLLGADILAM